MKLRKILSQNLQNPLSASLIFLVIGISVISLLMLGKNNKQSDTKPQSPSPSMSENMQAKCEKENGTWLSQYNECEGIAQSVCANLKGSFNECASACRHETPNTICTKQCIQVCSFKESNMIKISCKENSQCPEGYVCNTIEDLDYGNCEENFVGM